MAASDAPEQAYHFCRRTSFLAAFSNRAGLNGSAGGEAGAHGSFLSAPWGTGDPSGGRYLKGEFPERKSQKHDSMEDPRGAARGAAVPRTGKARFETATEVHPGDCAIEPSCTAIEGKSERTPCRWSTNRDGSEAGFTLLEMVCVLAILALLAAILLPCIPVATSRPRLEAYAVEVAALLKADRNAALARRGLVAASVDAPGRTVRSGASTRVVQLPDDVTVDALLPQRCDGRLAHSNISFFATGMSCGGTIRLTRFGSGFEVRVNWLTGSVDIVAQNNL